MKNDNHMHWLAGGRSYQLCVHGHFCIIYSENNDEFDTFGYGDLCAKSIHNPFEVQFACLHSFIR